MSQAFDIEISGDLVAAIPRIKDQDGYARRLAREMDFQNQLTIAQIQRFHLSGPTSDSSLSVRTNRLRGSIRASKTIILGTGVVSSIGTNVKYAAAHEFGVTTKPHDIRAKNGKALAFMVGGKKIFRKVVHHPGSKIPARAPIGHGIADRQPEYTAAFERVTQQFLEGQN